MKLEFKKWLEIFGQPVDQAEPIPASQYPASLNNTAFPSYEIDEPRPIWSKKRMKKKT
jgi:hypothetical protein